MGGRLGLRGGEHAKIGAQLELTGDVELGSDADETHRVEALAARAREIHARPLGTESDLNIGGQDELGKHAKPCRHGRNRRHAVHAVFEVVGCSGVEIQCSLAEQVAIRVECAEDPEAVHAAVVPTATAVVALESVAADPRAETGPPALGLFDLLFFGLVPRRVVPEDRTGERRGMKEHADGGNREREI